MRMRFFKTPWPLVLLAATLTVTSRAADAQLVITPAGAAQGLSVTTFATGFPSAFNIGPLGIGFVNGHVLVSDFPGNVRLFASDTDGQNAAAAPVTQFYGYNNANDIAQTGGRTYMNQQGIGDLVQINNDGTFNQIIVRGMSGPVGLVTDPVNGHLFDAAQRAGVIYDVDPIAKTKTVFVHQRADGLTITSDGKTLYAEVGAHILGFDTATGTQVFDSGYIPGADGTALGAGAFAGLVFANSNFGTLTEINLKTHAETVIATGGTRGDYVTVDPTNDTLLITQTHRIQRLHGATFASVPEPTSMVTLLLGLGLSGTALLVRRRIPK